MNREIFPSGSLLQLQQNCTELVCWASLFGAERPVMEGALWSVWQNVSIRMYRRAYRGNGGIAPRSLKLGTSWRWLVTMTPRPLYPWRKRFLYPLNRRRVGEPQRRCRTFGEQINLFYVPGLEPRAVYPVVCQYANCGIPVTERRIM